jgi:alpha-D-xyloside xylohydrolase
MALINAWYIKNPPWKQVERAANNADRLAADWEQAEAKCRTVLELRMRLVPYLHAAFVKYQRQGLPPFRALVMDYPDDPATWAVDDQYLMGESLLVAPVVAGEASRNVYLPAGDWVDFWTGRRYPGKQRIRIDVPLEQIPLFVKGGSILPLAEVTAHTADAASWRLHVQAYGNSPAQAVLYEDDGTWDPSLSEVTLSWQGEGSLKRSGSGSGPHYEVAEWKFVG